MTASVVILADVNHRLNGNIYCTIVKPHSGRSDVAALFLCGPALAKAQRGPSLRDGESENSKPLEWQGFYSLRRGIATQLTSITHDPMAAKGLLRHSSVNTTLAHYIKDVPEVTAKGMAQVEELFSELDAANQVVQ